MWLDLFDTLLASGVVVPTQMVFMTMILAIAFLVGLLIVLKRPHGFQVRKTLRTLTLCLTIYLRTFRKKLSNFSNQQV